MKTMLARFGLLSLAAAAALAAGCAQERDPINRVQANALPKAFFLGSDLKSADDDPEFRMKGYTIGSSVNQSAYTIGEFTAVDRVRWEVTEDMLLARRAYQEVEGADNRGVPKEDWGKHDGDKTFTKTATGTIVAAYKIDSHFDIRREYNAQTGEEMNVIGENTSDRPWNEREYMRVDWSKNLVASTNDSTRYFGLAKATPVEYSVTDPHVEVDNGYFDVTNKFTVEPAQIEFSWGSLPECVLAGFVTGSPSYDCNPQEATVRMSFARIEKDEDFERFEDTTAWRDVVGNWGGSGDGANPWLGAPRQKWDPAYGATDALTKRFKAIHNLWKKSHQEASCASNEDANKDGTADACANDVTGYEGNTGSQCDVYVNKCTIPVRDREVRTVGYFLNREAPDALQDEVDGEGNFVKQPQVSLLVTQVRGNQASVLGQVNRPGRYPLETAGLRLTELLATAGGVAANGADTVTLVGTRGGQPMRRVIDLPSLFRTDGGGDDPVIHHGDAVYVERAPLVYIYGEVQRPGALRLERGMTLLQALAAGGGLTQRGTDKGIRVHRRDAQGQVQVLTPGMDDRIQDGDVVYVRESLF